MDVKNLSEVELQTQIDEFVKNNPNRTPLEMLKNKFYSEKMRRSKQ
jgi:hypothetical protein